MSEGEFKKRLSKNEAYDDWGHLTVLTKDVNAVLDEAKKDFICVPYYVNGDEQVYIDYMDKIIKKWFGSYSKTEEDDENCEPEMSAIRKM